MEIKETISNSYNISECLRKLNWNITGSNYKKLNKIIKTLNIDISHFNPTKHLSDYKFKGQKNLSDLLISGSTTSTGTIKKCLYKEGLKKRECELCGQDEEWKGKKMSLILDHKNGINNDNRIENLRIVCPNCNATLDTHCGKNIKHSRYNQPIKLCSCGVEILKTSEHCITCARLKLRKISDRPNLTSLLIDIKRYGYLKTGKKYNVSDNAIRKWIKSYQNRGSTEN